MDRKIIFISHATHEDNYFATWLASKLKILGYEAWVDLDDLRAGDSFYTVIQPIIEKRAVKFIAINTKDYVRKAQNQHSGIARELNCAISVTDIPNFIIPLRVDETDYSQFPMHYKGWDSIDFLGNWQTGLINLEKELARVGIPKKFNPDNPISLWFESIKAQNTVIDKQEFYHSNWFEVKLPGKVYLHHPAKYLREQAGHLAYPFVVEANRILTFASQKQVNEVIPISHSDKFDATQFVNNEDIAVDDEFTLKESKKKFIWLLNNCFDSHLRSQNLIYWNRGKEAKRKMFYFRHSTTQKAIILQRYNKKRRKRKLTGQTTEKVEKVRQKVNWHFAISATADLHPKPHYKIFYSVVFTDKDYIRFDKDIQHALRRSVPSEWYNRKWFETLLAAMLKISPSINDRHIQIAIDENEFLEVSNEPFKGISEKGYIEPDNVD